MARAGAEGPASWIEVGRQGLWAGAVAGALSGIPSTVHAFATGRDPLAATKAAGTLALREDARPTALVAAAIPVHAALSAGWAAALAVLLPRRREPLWGAVAGLGIAALDLGVVGRRFPAIAALPTTAQIADHVAFGAVAGAVIARLRRPL